MQDVIFVTGGSGFIGSAVVRELLAESSAMVINIDKLTYAANPLSMIEVDSNPRYRFVHADICDSAAMTALFAEWRPRAVMHLAAESHVDRSIDCPMEFVQTNVVGTCILLQAAQAHWCTLTPAERKRFRFHHVSTDEVFGSLGDEGHFHETTPYAPSSPYSASKASSDHFVRAWAHTYGLPIVISNCSNNYGARQFPEKLIPLMIVKGLAREDLPVYGSGLNVRDWLYVEDHARALHTILERGQLGKSYNVGGDAERHNIDVVTTICDHLDQLVPGETPRRNLIRHVTDRPGHDFRYAIDSTRLRTELGWYPTETFESGIRQTILWYLENRPWWQAVLNGSYQGERLGLATSAF